mgnify:CR=1 FL=1
MVHPLTTVLGVVFVGVLCGAQGWDEILVFAEGKRSWLASWLDLTAGLPSPDTLRRVFSMLRPDTFAQHVYAWMADIAAQTNNSAVLRWNALIDRAKAKA